MKYLTDIQQGNVVYQNLFSRDKEYRAKALSEYRPFTLCKKEGVELISFMLLKTFYCRHSMGSMGKKVPIVWEKYGFSHTFPIIWVLTSYLVDLVAHTFPIVWEMYIPIVWEKYGLPIHFP